MVEKLEYSEDDRSDTDMEGHYKFKKSKLVKLISWWYVAQAYLPYVIYGLLGLLLLQILQVVFVHKLERKWSVDDFIFLVVLN